MRPVIIKLFQRRSAIIMRVIGNKSATPPSRNAHTGADRKACEFSFTQALGVVRIALEARPELQTQALEIKPLQRESRKSVLRRRRRQRLCADRIKVTVQTPEAKRPGVSSHLSLIEPAVI